MAWRTFVELPDPDLGTVVMTAPIPRLSGTPGHVRWTGPAPGAHDREVYGGLLVRSEAELADLQSSGVI